MQSSYAYQQPQGQPGVSHVHPSSSSSAAVMTPTTMVSLPPLRGLEPQILPPVSPMHPNMQHHSHYPAVSAPLSSYYQQPIHMQQMIPQPYMSLPIPPAPMRYAPIPAATDSRLLGGGRHRKEIKRRTKTGCLTCRKRRIKCDEQHPTCRNCQKSKRECAGYEPIFKSQKGQSASAPASNRSSSAGQTPSPTSQAQAFTSSPRQGNRNVTHPTEGDVASSFRDSMANHAPVNMISGQGYADNLTISNMAPGGLLQEPGYHSRNSFNTPSPTS